MFPVLFKIGPITIHTYGFLFAVGVLTAIILSLKLARREGLDKRRFSDLVFYTILLGLIGAKLFLMVTNLGYYLKNPAEIKYLLTSGGTFYGGLIFGMLFAVYYFRKHKMSVRALGDVGGPSVALAHFFGRLGCFCAGCCYGRPAGDSFLGIEFSSQYAHNHTGVPLQSAVYPTQLMEAILNLINFIILIFAYQKKRFQGQIFAMYIFNYSIIRFGIEYFRGDTDRGYIFGNFSQPFTSLSVPQLISLLGIVTAVIMYLGFKNRALKEKTD